MKGFDKFSSFNYFFSCSLLFFFHFYSFIYKNSVANPDNLSPDPVFKILDTEPETCPFTVETRFYSKIILKYDFPIILVDALFINYPDPVFIFRIRVTEKSFKHIFNAFVTRTSLSGLNFEDEEEETELTARVKEVEMTSRVKEAWPEQDIKESRQRKSVRL